MNVTPTVFKMHLGSRLQPGEEVLATSRGQRPGSRALAAVLPVVMLGTFASRFAVANGSNGVAVVALAVSGVALLGGVVLFFRTRSGGAGGRRLPRHHVVALTSERLLFVRWGGAAKARLQEVVTEVPLAEVGRIGRPGPHQVELEFTDGSTARWDVRAGSDAETASLLAELSRRAAAARG